MSIFSPRQKNRVCRESAHLVYQGSVFGIIHFVRTQSVPKNIFLPHDTHTHVYLSGNKKC